MAQAKKTLAPSEVSDVLVEESPDTPEKIVMATKFDKHKRYMFELAVENEPRELPIMVIQNNKSTVDPHRKFKPYVNIVYTSEIVWEGERRIIRYYDGCTTLFQEDQPKDKDVMAGFMKRTKKRAFLEGRFGCHGDERMLLLYLTICSWNAESPFRTRTASEVFRPSNADKLADEKTARMDNIEKALVLAREANAKKMKMHAAYLGIPEIDYESGNEWTQKELRSLYREKAASHPVQFIESYGNKNMETKWFIQKALESGLINNKVNPNKAAWKGSNSIICDISGLKSTEAIANALFEFSKLEEGEEFLIQLKALNQE